MRVEHPRAGRASHEDVSRPIRTLVVACVLVASLGGATLACSALKTADTGEAPDGGDVPAATEDGSTAVTPNDASAPEDASTPKDAAGPGAEPCTESLCPTDVIAKDLYGPVGVAVNGTHVFWIEVGSTIPKAGGYGQLIRLPKGTTCTDRSCFDVVDGLVLEGQLEGRYIYETHLALGANDVCYTQSYNASPGHSISCFALDTLKKRNLTSGVGAAVSLWVGAGSARWAIGANGATKGDIRGRDLDGGGLQVLAPSRPDPTSVTGDGSGVFFTERAAAGAPLGSVAALRADGGVSVLAPGRDGPTAATVHGAHVYWLEYGARLVMRVRADGSGAPEQIATTDPNPFGLVVDASGVYWASAGAALTGSEGSVARAPLTPGGKTTVMMSNVRTVYDLAVDATSVYVASVGAQLGAGRVVRMNKTR